MTRRDDHIPVLAAPHFDPAQNRVAMEVPAGVTIAEIVHLAMPGAGPAVWQHTRVALVTPKGMEAITIDYWRMVRPRPGVQVVIRVIPSKNALRSILQIVVAVAAYALAGPIAGALGFTGALGTALVATGITVLGNLLINAIVPPPSAPDNDKRNTYTISELKNQVVPGGAVPVVLGTYRFAPPYGALPYTQVVGDDQYICALFVLGEGEIQIDDIRIGETSIAEYDEVEVEVRNGVDGDLPLSLITQQRPEKNLGVELTRPLPRDDAGNVVKVESETDWDNAWETGFDDFGDWSLTGGIFGNEDSPAPGIETPVVRTTGRDAAGADVLLYFPAGLVKYNDDGDKREHIVSIKVEHRLIEAEEWQEVEILTIKAKKAEAFWRHHEWSFPTRGQWQVRCTMLTDESDDTKKMQRVNWAALQTIRPEYPLNYPRPLALLAMRLKATHQLNGALDEVNVLAFRICLDWDAETGTWIKRATSNPAALFRYVLQAPENVKAVTDAEINLEKLQLWHEFCTAKGLTYNNPLSGSETLLGDVLKEIAAAGRATPEHDGTQWSVVIDNPTDPDALIVDHISAHNSWGFKAPRSYFKPPHAVIVQFNDAANDYKSAEHTVRWPGYEGEIIETEAWPQSGKVHADEVWRETRRRQLEALYRPDTYQATRDGLIHATTRGDHVMTNSWQLSNYHHSARVLKVSGNLIEIDSSIAMTTGATYVIRFRVFSDETDVIGLSVTRTLKFEAGEISLLTVLGNGPMPEKRSVITIGPATEDAYRQIVRGVERTSDGCCIFHMVDAAPEIDEELDATEIPAWSARIGEIIDDNLLQPSAPRFASISTGMSGTDQAGLIVYLIEPGSGAVPTASYRVEHRLSGAPDWTVATMPVANGGGDIEGYATGDLVEIRAAGISASGITGPYTVTVTIIVGEQDADIPAALDEAGITVTTLLGGALIQIATGDDAATTALQVYRSTSDTLDRETDAVGAPLAVAPQSSYSTTLGDTTRENLIAGGAMDNATTWTLDAGWAVASGVATHTTGTADAIAQPLAATAGKFYRLGFTLYGMTAGSLTPRLTGGSDRPGTDVTLDGTFSDRIQAVTGNDTLGFLATSDFDGTLDDVTAYLETSGCLAQGTHYVWVEPQNADGLNGAVSGPFEITII